MTLLGALKPFVAPAGRPRAGPGCELCGARLEPEHPHLVDVRSRAIACSCRACSLLFAHTGRNGHGWRAVPERYLFDRDFVLREEEWEALGIPVSMAFFFESSVTGQWTAVYPSPAGPVESLLGLDAWSSIASRTRLARSIEPDVEALLVTSKPGAGRACLLIPIHACYALVGLVRRSWRGFDGGEEARRAIDQRLGAWRARCEAVGGGAP